MEPNPPPPLVGRVLAAGEGEAAAAKQWWVAVAGVTHGVPRLAARAGAPVTDGGKEAESSDAPHSARGPPVGNKAGAGAAARPLDRRSWQ